MDTTREVRPSSMEVDQIYLCIQHKSVHAGLHMYETTSPCHNQLHVYFVD